MSSLLALQTKNTIVFASDTALSTKVKDKRYRVGNNETKLFDYPDFIMFASGKKYLRDMFIDILSDSPTISDIQFVLDTYIIQHSEEYSLEIVIAMKDLSKLVFFSSADEFSYSENLPNEYTNLFTAGCLTNEVASKFEESYSNYPLLQSLQNTYKELSCDEIGGNLDVIILEKDNIRKLQFPIDNKETHSDEKVIELLTLVFANKLHGRILLSNKLWVEDDLGVIEIQSGLQTVYDQNGVPRVFLGRYPTYDNPNVFDYGLRIDDGKFTMRTSTTDKRGIQIDGQGIRGFNSNGVKTFDLDTSGHASFNGSITIKSSPDSNKGVVIDGDGLRGYNSSGALTFEINNNGSAWFSGRLVSATGSVNDLTGSIKDMTGSVTNLTGTLNGMNGTFSGTLEANTVSAINIRADQITSGKISSQLIDTQSLTAATITAEQITSGKISSQLIDTQSLSAANITAEQITSGSIDGDRIAISGRMQIYGGIKLHSGGLYSGIYFDSNQIMQTTDNYLTIGSNVSIGAFTKFNGRVDFTGCDVIGLK